MAYDTARKRLVLFGGLSATRLRDTWEWDGTRWTNHTPTTGNPPARSNHAIAYDSARQRIVLFGGSDVAGGRADTWEWDGTRWTNHTPTTGNPPARSDHAMVYDSARRRVVLFGGSRSSGQRLADTWEWDGTSWTNHTPTTGNPPARSDHAMAYDSVRSRAVLFGGSSTVLQFADTWEWDGTSWTNHTPATGNPPRRSGHATAYDSARGRVVLFGGRNAGLQFADTWEWDGTSWTNHTPTTGNPPARSDHAMAYDSVRSRAVLFGGRSNQRLADTREWDGTSWTSNRTGNPPARASHAMAYDSGRKRVVLFGGAGISRFADTWEWDGTIWSDRTLASGYPAARMNHEMAYDSARNRVVLFGGLDALNGSLLETWEWDGTQWSDRTPVTGSPPARHGHALTFDSARNRVVLFGGRGKSGGLLADTWEWDGTSWTNRTPATGNPPRRGEHAMAYDSVRKHVVLFAGNADASGGQLLADTWEWDGTSWTSRTPTTGGPLARAEHAMAYHAGRQGMVVFGGRDSRFNTLADTWEWDGTKWTNRTPSTGSPPAHYLHTIAYDSERTRLVLFGGSVGSLVADTWETPSLPARFTTYGAGCVGSAGVPRLDAPSVPWIGEPFIVEVSSFQVLAPAVALLMGFSKNNLSLAPIGAPGCTLLLAPTPPHLWLQASSGQASLSANVPNLLALAGTSLYLQAFVPDLNANPLGVVATNAGHGVFGKR